MHAAGLRGMRPAILSETLLFEFHAGGQEPLPEGTALSAEGGRQDGMAVAGTLLGQ